MTELLSTDAESRVVETQPATVAAAAVAPVPKVWRNLAAFWVLGLCNNYAYVIMLSAAHDILSNDFHATGVYAPPRQTGAAAASGRDCNPTSTGAILLADILPALFAKMVSPAVNVHAHVRVAVTVLLSGVSFLLVATAMSSPLTYTGVVCASLSSGIGEVTFLAYSSHFHSDVVSTWSSGTGFSGVIGSFSYAALVNAGLSPRNTLLVMLFSPVIMTLAYVFLLKHPASRTGASQDSTRRADAAETVPLNWSQKRALLRQLPIFMLPLGLVYTAEYFINQGLVELIWFKGIWLSHDDQYRWLQTVYQVGVCISRSSVNLIHVRRIWIFTVLQMLNAVLFFCEAYWLFLRSFWLVATLVLWEGLLGGCAYVNTFYTIYHQFTGRDREFIMGTVSLADTAGVAVAGVFSLPVHNALCRLPGPRW